MAPNRPPNNNTGNNSGVNPPPPPPITSPAADITSIYYVHPGDGPSSVAVTPVLSTTGANYHSWARSMRRALVGKNKFDFVDGSIEVPDSFHPSYKAWNRCNTLVHSWIINSVAESIAHSIVFLENAIDVWKELHERFSQGDLIKISELQCEIHALKQGSLNVTEFFSELKTLWEELEAYMPEPSCGCPRKCVCASGIELAQKHHTLSKTIRFLTGLNENFSVIKSQVLLMEPLPNLNKIFSMVIQHERQFVASDESKSIAASVSTDTRKGFGRGKGGVSPNYKGKVCTHCGKTGHTIDVCYKKHGFPPNLGKNSAANSVSSESKEESKLGLSKEQFERLMTMMQETKVAASTSAKANMISAVDYSPIADSGQENQEEDWFGSDV